MITLHAPNGEPVSVRPEAISSMYPNDGTYHHAAHTILVVGGQHQAVIETIEVIEALIDRG